MTPLILTTAIGILIHNADSYVVWHEAPGPQWAVEYSAVGPTHHPLACGHTYSLWASDWPANLHAAVLSWRYDPGDIDHDGARTPSDYRAFSAAPYDWNADGQDDYLDHIGVLLTLASEEPCP